MDRRNWFRIASAASGALVLNPFWKWDMTHPLDNGSPDLVRLCYNENPYGPSEKARQAIINSFDIAHQYPFAYVEELAAKLASKHGVSREHIVVTGGSREGLAATGLTFAEEGGNIVAPSPTYQAMLRYARQFGMHIYDVPVNRELGHDLDGMHKRITNRTNLVFICNPNNPTGTIIPTPEIRSFSKSISGRTIAFVDEAYNDYVTEEGFEDMTQLVKEDLNVIVSRTFSKVYGLAGIRIGYLIARPDIADRIRTNLMASTNIPAIMAASAALDDAQFYEFSKSKNSEGKEMIYSALDLLGLEYKKSHTNFVFFKSGMDIVKLNEKMRSKGVLVGRPFPPFTDWCRISTGKTEDVEQFCSTIKNVLA
ncbi:pyridoxal phosphate-dependent aminotransferase [Portibacter marinus]|uniref:pyridoxal phosphate-dependent aminotransferase n=1 Tax=Portibacter marinus TaxID=2898660 RepID=UPI001F20B35E|nr:histidinol-phosphate transaminase [Portibacter marinus]